MSITADVVFDQRHKLDPRRAHDRESLVWIVTDPVQRFGLVGYTWVDAAGVAGAAGIAFGGAFAEPVFHRVDGVPVSSSEDFSSWSAGPITVSHEGSERRAHVAYVSDGLSLDFTFAPMGVPYPYTSHPDPFPRYFADERLEQGGVAKGTATVDGQRFTLDCFAHRDHSWGARDWGSTLHYKWLNFLAPDLSVHVMDLHGLGRSDARGYVHKDGTTAQIVRSTFAYELDEAMVHRQLALELEDEAGRTTRATMTEDGDAFTYPIDPRLTLIDVIGRGEIDGVAGSAYVEMAWPPEYIEHGTAVRRQQLAGSEGPGASAGSRQ